MSCKTAPRRKPVTKLISFDVVVRSLSGEWTYTRGIATLDRAREIALEASAGRTRGVIVLRVTKEPVSLGKPRGRAK